MISIGYIKINFKNMKKFIIESEDSSIHWPNVEVKDKIVLDLGCGRWCNRYGGENTNFKEFSPIYFSDIGAKKVIGVDASNGEIDFFKDKTIGNIKFEFIHKKIENKQDLLDLIKNNKIQVIKCDIEGAEENFYEITKEDLSEVSYFALEYHDEKIREKFISLFDNWGFTIESEGLLWGENVGVLFAKKNII